MVSLHTIVGYGKWDSHTIPLSNYPSLWGELKAYYIPGPVPEVNRVWARQEDPLLALKITVGVQCWPEFLSLLLKYAVQTSQFPTVAWLNEDYKKDY